MHEAASAGKANAAAVALEQAGSLALGERRSDDVVEAGAEAGGEGGGFEPYREPEREGHPIEDRR